jgi:hypothetical protein
MPAKAGIQNYMKTLDSRLRGNDAKGRFKTFYETINIQSTIFNPFSGAKETTDGIFSKPDQRIAVGKFLRPHRVGIFHGVQHSDAV